MLSSPSGSYLQPILAQSRRVGKGAWAYPIVEIWSHAMNVTEAVAARRSVRGFLEKPVDGAILRAIVTKAARAATGGNLQPWHVDLVSGESLASLKAVMMAKLMSGETEEHAYDIYPPGLTAPYRDRRFATG